jgi:hypothetical protein
VNTMPTTVFSFPTSAFPPLAVGFFGLGTGYLIYGPQELFGRPPRSRAVDISYGLWGIWMPGFMQFVAGIFLFASLVWFHSLSAPSLYMAALAFTAYGVHWWAIGGSRLAGGDPRANAYMAIAFVLISALGVTVFASSDSRDIPVALIFAGLVGVYFFEFFASWFPSAPVSADLPAGRLARDPLGLRATRALGFTRLLTGSWLMYMTWAATLDFASGYHLWL